MQTLMLIMVIIVIYLIGCLSWQTINKIITFIKFFKR